MLYDLLYQSELPEINALSFLQDNEIDIESSFRQEWCHYNSQDLQEFGSIGGASLPEVASLSPSVQLADQDNQLPAAQISAMTDDPAMAATEVKPPDPPPSDFFTAIEAANMTGVDWDR